MNRKTAHQIQSHPGMQKHWRATQKEECFQHQRDIRYSSGFSALILCYGDQRTTSRFSARDLLDEDCKDRIFNPKSRKRNHFGPGSIGMMPLHLITKLPYCSSFCLLFDILTSFCVNTWFDYIRRKRVFFQMAQWQFDWSILMDVVDLKAALMVLEIPRHNCLLKMKIVDNTSLLYSGSVRNTGNGRFLSEF